MAAPQEKLVYLVEDPLAAEALSDADGRLEGEDRSFGEALAGDGESLVVGQPGSGSDPGVVFLFNGLGAGTTSASAADTRLDGAAGRLLGASLAISDLDGDGFPDLAVGWGAEAGLQVHDGPLLSLDSDGISTGPIGEGESIVSAGDLDGDGYPELVHGMPTTNDGAVRVYSGPIHSEASFEPALLVAGGEGDRLGSAVLSCDLDHSDTADLFVAALGRGSEAGAVLGFYQPTLSGTLDAEDSDMRLTGTEPGESLGTDLACGPVRSTEDLLVGSPHWQEDGLLYGAVRLVEGGGL